MPIIIEVSNGVVSKVYSDRRTRVAVIDLDAESVGETNAIVHHRATLEKMVQDAMSEFEPEEEDDGDEE